MLNGVLLLALAMTGQAPAPASLPTEPFEAPKYGLAARIPKVWKIAEHEKEDRVFVAMVPQPEFGSPGVAACELALAPESLDDYRTRIDKTAERGGRPNAKLASNRIVKDTRGERLETVWELHPLSGGFWREVTIRVVANRQLYAFILNVEDSVYKEARTAFDALVAGTTFTPPNTGADLLSKPENRWLQREYKFAIELPDGWSPVLAPSSVALLFANGPAHGVWSDNLLVLAHHHRKVDLADLARELPEQLRREEPGCEVVSCQIIPHGQGQALETIARTRRGPFSMTVIEWRFRGERFDYEVKFTVESDRFDRLAPALRKSFGSFREMPGSVPAATGKAAGRSAAPRSSVQYSVFSVQCSVMAILLSEHRPLAGDYCEPKASPVGRSPGGGLEAG